MLFAAVLITSCASLSELFTGEEDKNAYKTDTTTQSLDVPPDLVTPAIEKGLLIPGEEESVSQYSSVRASQMANTIDSSPTAPAALSRQSDGAGTLIIHKSFSKTWRDVAIALSASADIDVTDRDRSGGLFYVQYIDPDAPEPGFFSFLAFWRSSEESQSIEYRIKLLEKIPGETEVTVIGAREQRVESPEQAHKLLSTIHSKLK